MTGAGPLDRVSAQWVEQLHAGHPRREEAVARLRDVLLRVASLEVSRRRGQLGSIGGPELDDLAHQAADDALMNVLAKLDESQGLSRFTTWGTNRNAVYKNLFDARRNLRASMEAAGHPVLERDAA